MIPSPFSCSSLCCLCGQMGCWGKRWCTKCNSMMPPPEIHSQIGSDEWVAQVQGRRRRQGWGDAVARRWLAIPLGVRYALVVALLALLPWVTSWPLVLEVLGVTDNAFIVRTLAGFLVA